MTTTGPVLPTTVSQTSSGAVAWSNLTNITADDGGNATADFSGGFVSEPVTCKGFDFSSVGDTDEVTSVTATIEAGVSGSGDPQLLAVQLVIAGTPSGSQFSPSPAFDSAAMQARTKTLTADQLALSLTGADLKHADFGLTFRASDGDSGTVVSVDHVSITVEHESSGGGGGDAKPWLYRSFTQTLGAGFQRGAL